MNEKKGKVWLVGAGPGDIGLLTIKGKEVLERADAVVYDSLVGAAILCLIPESAEQIDVGKRAGNHPVPQPEINRILLRLAQQGKRVVRLKGGDPFVFGRGGEELELLWREGIPFEIVPGITSATAVPAYAGIPVTHRDFASSLHILTGHRRADCGSDPIPYQALVRAGGTFVFLMGTAALPDICSGLTAAGMPADTPAAILQEGTTAAARTLLADLGTLWERAREEQIQPPAVVVVGEVCTLHGKFEWRSKLPLEGCRILLTRPKERMAALSGRLRALGAEVLEIPSIRLGPCFGTDCEPSFNSGVTETEEADAEPEGSGNPYLAEHLLSEMQTTGNLSRFCTELFAASWLVFTSPSGVNLFFECCLQPAGVDIRMLAGKKIAVLGPGTGRELGKRGLYPDLMPNTFDAASLGKTLAEQCEPDAHILIARAAAGSPALMKELEQRPDLQITDLPVYQTFPGKTSAIDLHMEFAQDHIFCVVFTSASGVRGFAGMVQPTRETGFDFSSVRAICIGQQTKAQAEYFGMNASAARAATEDALVEEILHRWEECREG